MKLQEKYRKKKGLQDELEKLKQISKFVPKLISESYGDKFTSMELLDRDDIWHYKTMLNFEVPIDLEGFTIICRDEKEEKKQKIYLRDRRKNCIINTTHNLQLETCNLKLRKT